VRLLTASRSIPTTRTKAQRVSQRRFTAYGQVEQKRDDKWSARLRAVLQSWWAQEKARQEKAFERILPKVVDIATKWRKERGLKKDIEDDALLETQLVLEPITSRAEEKRLMTRLERHLNREGLANFEDAAERANRAITGKRIDFRLRDPEVLDALEERANLLSFNVSDRVFDDLRMTIARGAFLEGKNPLQLMDDIRGIHSKFEKQNIPTIARTEVQTIANSARFETYERGGLENARWLTARDSKVRDAHRANALAGPTKLGDTYPSGQIRPGVGSASLVCNCRCTLIPVIDKLIVTEDAWHGARRSDMTPEQVDNLKKRQKERREKRKATETPEQREERLRRQRERRRARRIARKKPVREPAPEATPPTSEPVVPELPSSQSADDLKAYFDDVVTDFGRGMDEGTKKLFRKNWDNIIEGLPEGMREMVEPSIDVLGYIPKDVLLNNNPIYAGTYTPSLRQINVKNVVQNTFTRENVLGHEMGHALDSILSIGGPEGHARDYVSSGLHQRLGKSKKLKDLRKRFEGLWKRQQEALKEAGGWHKLRHAGRLSPNQYGTTNSQEFFATSFESYVMKGRKRLHEDMGDFMDDLMTLARNRWVD